jgi:hypothetical protein
VIAISPNPLAATYPTAHLRGQRMTLSPEEHLYWVNLDANRAEELGRERIGWLVGKHPGVTEALAQFGRLAALPAGGLWVVVPVSRELSCELQDRWPTPQHIAVLSDARAVWRQGKVVVAPPEGLRSTVSLCRESAAGVAGVIVLDPDFFLHRARGWTDNWGHVHNNDRPQYVVNFLADLEVCGWQPPLVLLTTRPAAQVAPELLASAYCRNAFWPIRGNSFACWEVPIE